MYLFLLLCSGLYSQLKFYDLQGNLLDVGEGNSINSVKEKNFPEEVLTKSSFVDYKEAEFTTIICKMFSYEPIFILGEFPKGKEKEYIKSILDIFKNEHSKNYFIDHERMVKYDLMDAIEKKATDLFILKRLGKPSNSYEDSQENKIYSYRGDLRTIDIIFKNGYLADFKIYGGY